MKQNDSTEISGSSFMNTPNRKKSIIGVKHAESSLLVIQATPNKNISKNAINYTRIILITIS